MVILFSVKRVLDPPPLTTLRYEPDMISDCCLLSGDGSLANVTSSDTQGQLFGAGEVNRAKIG